MKIDDLVRVMPPSPAPVESPVEDEWGIIEEQIGTGLPEDYKQFIRKYGSGRIGKFLWIYNPFSQNENLNLKSQIKLQLSVLSELESYGEVLPYKLFPELGGLLPFASTDNGDVLFWLTSGAPDDWRVIVNEARSPEWEAFDVPMTEFLFAILTHQLVCQIFPKNFPGLSPAFEAIR